MHNLATAAAMLGDTPKAEEPAVDWLAKAAQAGYAPSQYSMGVRSYSLGQHREARDWFAKATDQGHLDSLVALGKLDLGEAPAGDLGAMGLLTGAIPAAEAGLPQAPESGFARIMKAAAEGHDLAAYYVVGCFEEGRGTPRSLRDALNWLLKSTNRGWHGFSGFPTALREFLLRHPDFAVDWQAVLPEVRRGAQAGFRPQTRLLGTAYELGWGVPPDRQEARRWFELGDDKEGLRRLDASGAYPPSSAPSAPEERKGYDTLPKPADVAVSSPEAMAKRAWELIGDAGEQDKDGIVQISEPDVAMQIRQLLEGAANAGHADSAYWLGDFFARGSMWGIKNRNLAAKWYRRAADSGGVGHQHRVGRTFLDKTMGPDVEAARHYLSHAAHGGNLSAMCDLADTYTDPAHGRRDPGKAMEWTRRAAEMGHGPAIVRLGEFYANGDGVPQDLARAAAFFREAHAKGEAEAERQLIGIDRKLAKTRLEVDQADRRELDWINDQYSEEFGTEFFEGDMARRHETLATAFYTIGLKVERGDLAARKPGEAADWFSLAANLLDKDLAAGSMGAFRYAGQQGQPVPEQVHALQMACRYLAGAAIPVRKSKRTEALPLLVAELAKVARTDFQARTDLAQAYLLGLGVPKNEARAARLLREAADAGNLGAACVLGGMYSDERLSTKLDKAKALKAWRAAQRLALQTVQPEGRVTLQARVPPSPAYEQLIVRFRKAQDSAGPNNAGELRWSPRGDVLVAARAYASLPTRAAVRSLARTEGVPDWLADRIWASRALLAKTAGAASVQKAWPWLLKAAQAGEPNSQAAVVGVLREHYDSKPDLVEAMRWGLILEATFGGGWGSFHRVDLVGPTEILRAQEMASAWWDKHPPPSSGK